MCDTCDWQKSGGGGQLVCIDHGDPLNVDCARCGAKLCPRCASRVPVKYPADGSDAQRPGGGGTNCFWCASGLA